MKTLITQAALSMFILVMVVTFSIMCGKTAPRQSFPLEVSAGCADTAGVYVPVFTNLINVSTVAGGGSGHFIRVCNEVTVTGTFSMFGAPINPAGTSFVTMSLPIPITATTEPEPGLIMVFQSGVKYPINGQLLTNGNGTVTVKWNPTGTGASSVTYHFVYTIN